MILHLNSFLLLYSMCIRFNLVHFLSGFFFFPFPPIFCCAVSRHSEDGHSVEIVFPICFGILFLQLHRFRIFIGEYLIDCCRVTALSETLRTALFASSSSLSACSSASRRWTWCHCSLLPLMDRELDAEAGAGAGLVSGSTRHPQIFISL